MEENVPLASSNGANHRTRPVVSKMSFASVCSSQSLGNQTAESNQVAALPPKNVSNNKVKTTARDAIRTPMTGSLEPAMPLSSSFSRASRDGGLTESLAKLEIQESSNASRDLAERDVPEVLQYVPKLDDEKTHLSVSSTKAPSLDGKSVVSIATFAMDEKESIRPDDSASVQAAEDDDSNSGPGSGAQNSRFGSETGGKAFHAQLREISIQRIPLPQKVGTNLAEERRPVVHSNSTGINVVPPPLVPQGLPLPQQYSYWMPDEKLLEALDSPKDRLFLLQLEQQIISFIQNHQDNSLDLPPYNSFFRLLAHRLGDYYRLSHFVDSNVNAVRLYKTQSTQLPTPLSAFRPDALSDSAPAMQPSMKIMRRMNAGLSNEGHTTVSTATTDPNSIAPSKAGSEAGEEVQKISGVASPTGSSTAKDKASQSREEREAKYKEVRERIFGDWKEGETSIQDQSNTTSADASRASSVSGKKKKRNNKNDDDGFEARSAFYRQQPVNFDPSGTQVAFFHPYMMQNGMQMFQPNFGQNYNPQYPTTPQPQMFTSPMPQQAQMSSTPAMYQQPPHQQYVNYGMQPQLMPAQYFPQMQQPQAQVQYQQPFVPNPAYGPFNPQMSGPSSQMQDPNWNQGTSQGTYPVYASPQMVYPPPAQQNVQSSPSNSMSLPYAYGQLPYQAHSPNNRNAHPVPGSYQRQNFNAQARVFVPGESGPHASATNDDNRQSLHLPQSQGNVQGPFQYSHPMPSMPHNQYMSSLATSTSGSPRKSSNQTSQSQSPATSTISKWGNPSTLPPKPPSTLPPKPPPPANSHMPGASIPTYQNGTYSRSTGGP